MGRKPPPFSRWEDLLLLHSQPAPDTQATSHSAGETLEKDSRGGWWWWEREEEEEERLQRMMIYESKVGEKILAKPPPRQWLD